MLAIWLVQYGQMVENYFTGMNGNSSEIQWFSLQNSTLYNSGCCGS